VRGLELNSDETKIILKKCKWGFKTGQHVCVKLFLFDLDKSFKLNRISHVLFFSFKVILAILNVYYIIGKNMEYFSIKLQWREILAYLAMRKNWRSTCTSSHFHIMFGK